MLPSPGCSADGKDRSGLPHSMHDRTLWSLLCWARASYMPLYRALTPAEVAGPFPGIEDTAFGKEEERRAEEEERRRWPLGMASSRPFPSRFHRSGPSFSAPGFHGKLITDKTASTTTSPQQYLIETREG